MNDRCKVLIGVLFFCFLLHGAIVSDKIEIENENHSKLEKFIEWSKEGIKTNDLGIKYFDNMGYGVFATKDISEGELLLEVEDKMIITLLKVKEIFPYNFYKVFSYYIFVLFASLLVGLISSFLNENTKGVFR